MKTLIVSDVHLRWEKVDSILGHESHDSVIFLGDYFDQFHDTPEQNRRSAEWLKESLNNKNRIHLIGNHDLSYMHFHNAYCYCSGFEHLKSKAINEVLSTEDWEKLKFYHAQDGILFSHAGLSKRLINQNRLPFKKLDDLIEHLDKNVPIIKTYLKLNKSHWFYQCGWSRGGRDALGGFTWSDFDVDHISTPFPQIIGHTPHPKPLFQLRTPDGPNLKVCQANEVDTKSLSSKWWTIDLDTHSNHYATLENNNLIIKEISWENNNINYSFEIFNQQIA